MVKIGTNGNMEWSRSVQGEDHNWPEHIIATSDGGWLVAGYTMNALTTVRDLEAIKFNSGAQIEWVGIYTGADEDYVYFASECLDGGYLLTGHSYSYGGNAYYSVVIMKISSNGAKTWSKLIGGWSSHSTAEAVA